MPRRRKANYVNLSQRKRKSHVRCSKCNLVHQMATCVEIVTFDLAIQPELVAIAEKLHPGELKNRGWQIAINKLTSEILKMERETQLKRETARNN